MFFYWTTKEKLAFTDWSEVHLMFRSGKIAIVLQRIMIDTPDTICVIKQTNKQTECETTSLLEQLIAVKSLLIWKAFV